MEKDIKIVGNEQGVDVRMQRQIRTLCYYPERVSFEIARLIKARKSYAEARSQVEHRINTDEEYFGGGWCPGLSPSEKRRVLLNACYKIMQMTEKNKDALRSRNAYLREPSRVSSRSRCTSRTAASASSSGGGDSGGSEPPQSDPDLPSFRFVRSGLIRSYLKTDRFLSSWRPGRLGLMAHVRRWAA